MVVGAGYIALYSTKGTPAMPERDALRGRCSDGVLACSSRGRDVAPQSCPRGVLTPNVITSIRS